MKQGLYYDDLMEYSSIDPDSASPEELRAAYAALLARCEGQRAEIFRQAEMRNSAYAAYLSTETQRQAVDRHLNMILNSRFYQLSQKFYALQEKLMPLLKAVKGVLRRDRGEQTVSAEAEAAAAAEEAERIKQRPCQLLHELGKFERMDVVTTPHTLFIAKLIQRQLQQVGIACSICLGEPREYEDIPYIIVCPQFVEHFPKVYAAFQMEQSVSTRWFTDDYIYNRLHGSFCILDYSLENIDYFKKNLHPDISGKVYYLPVDYCPGFADHLPEEEKEYDVLFYGDANSCQRRREMLEELSRHFKVKVCSGLFGEDMYREIRKAKVLVNIHYYEGALLETTRLYETLSLNSCVIVSEDSHDTSERERLQDYVDFVDIGDTGAMIERIRYWLADDARREARVRRNQQELEQRSNAFSFYFNRFLLAHDRMDFDTFYELSGDFVQVETEKLCLTLPESTRRRASFDADNHYGFQCIPGLRHQHGWVGCGLSYKLMFTKALEAGFPHLIICEDDVIFPENFSERLDRILDYLAQQKRWSVFSGLMADVGQVQVRGCHEEADGTFLEIDHMISTVFNIYNEEMFAIFKVWDEANRDAAHNTIDRYLEGMDLSIFVQVPFLVGHKEELESTIWGFKNVEYSDMIRGSQQKLQEMAATFSEQSK